MTTTRRSRTPTTAGGPSSASPSDAELRAWVLVLVGQRQRPRAVVAMPLVIVREAVVLPELSLLVGRQLPVGVDPRGLLDLLLLQGDPNLVVVRGLRVADRHECVPVPKRDPSGS
jgi:hypothetical protein